MIVLCQVLKFMISFYDFGLTKPESLKCLKSEKHEIFYHEILRNDLAHC